MNKNTQEKFEQWFERYSKIANLKEDHIKMAIKAWAWAAWGDASLSFESALHDLKLLKESNDFYIKKETWIPKYSSDRYPCQITARDNFYFDGHFKIGGKLARQINKKLKFDYSELEE